MVATGIALISLLVSVATVADGYLRRQREEKSADVGARFVWLRTYTKVKRSDGVVKEVGYNLVLRNDGPARADDVTIEIWSLHRDELGRRQERLLDVAPDEFPLRLDPGVLYPIPFELEREYSPKPRRYVIALHWRDGAGEHVREVTLRRGQTSS